MKISAIVFSALPAAISLAPGQASAQAFPESILYARVSLVNACASSGSGEPLQLIAKPMRHGVTNLTIANNDKVFHRVSVFPAECSLTESPAPSPGPGCFPAPGGGQPHVEVIVPARSTLVVTYPTPLLYNLTGGASCVFAQVHTKTQLAPVIVMATGLRE